MIMANNTGRFFEGLVVGGLLGFVFGLLSAPKSGAELRRQIADGSEDLYKHASDSIDDFKSNAGHRITEIKDKTENAIGDLKGKSNEVMKKPVIASRIPRTSSPTSFKKWLERVPRCWSMMSSRLLRVTEHQ